MTRKFGFLASSPGHLDTGSLDRKLGVRLRNRVAGSWERSRTCGNMQGKYGERKRNSDKITYSHDALSTATAPPFEHKTDFAVVLKSPLRNSCDAKMVRSYSSQEKLRF